MHWEPGSLLFANGGIRTYEKFPVRGFLSSMEVPVHIGLDKTIVDSAFLIWPDNSFQPIQLEAAGFRYPYSLISRDFQNMIIIF